MLSLHLIPVGHREMLNDAFPHIKIGIIHGCGFIMKAVLMQAKFLLSSVRVKRMIAWTDWPSGVPISEDLLM